MIKSRLPRSLLLFSPLLSLLVTNHHFSIFVDSFSVVSKNNYGQSSLRSKDHKLFAGTSDVGEPVLNGEKDYINNDNPDDYSLRFSGAARLFSSDDLPQSLISDRLKNATVAVIGIGGVGSWTAEALCRSGIGNIILVDLDDVCISNTNRQLHAMSSTVGDMKTDVMKRRLLDINPQCNVTILHDFITVDNVYDIVDSMLPQLTVCVDAIDGQVEKTALIAACCVRRIPIVTCGGAAGRMDPTKIVCDDLTRAVECRLLFRCRKSLREDYGLFSKGPSDPKEIHKFKARKWRIASVFSTEIQKVISQKSDKSASSFRRCDGPLGTACFVTGTYGFVAAGKVIDMISNQQLPVPKILKQHKKASSQSQ